MDYFYQPIARILIGALLMGGAYFYYREALKLKRGYAAKGASIGFVVGFFLACSALLGNKPWW